MNFIASFISLSASLFYLRNTCSCLSGIFKMSLFDGLYLWMLFLEYQQMAHAFELFFSWEKLYSHSVTFIKTSLEKSTQDLESKDLDSGSVSLLNSCVRHTGWRWLRAAWPEPMGTTFRGRQSVVAGGLPGTVAGDTGSLGPQTSNRLLRR